MPAITAAAAVFVNIVLNLTLIWFMGTSGLALSTAICSYLQVVTLLFVLRRFLQKQGLGSLLLNGLVRTLVKTIVATLCMAATAGIALWLSKDQPCIFKLLLAVPSAAAVYLLTAKLLHLEQLSLLTGSKETKNSKPKGCD